MSITIAAINTAILDTLAAADIDELTTQDFDEISENVNDLPLLRVIFDHGQTDYTSNTDRTTFGAGVRQTHLVFNVDLWTAQRSFLKENIETVITAADAIWDVLDEQVSDLFGLDEIKAFDFNALRVRTEEGNNKYMGIRFILDIYVF